MEMMTYLVCPNCRGDIAHAGAALNCRNCGAKYPVIDEVPRFDLPQAAEGGAAYTGRDERRTYWDSGWQARKQGDHAFLSSLQSRSDWHRYLEEATRKYTAAGHVSCIEAGRDAVHGNVVLDIGCGGGTSSAVFGYFGAHYIGIDHSAHAATNSLQYLRCVGGDGFTIQGNAEALPIRDDSIDVVYSNGVLHHTPNFRTAVDEAFRVLKPGGKAIIGLYSTYSTQFGLLRLIGALRGNLTRRAMDRWMSDASEGAWRTGNKLNPWTETFSAAQLRDFMRKYQVVGLKFRKNGHPIGDFPKYGVRLMRFAPIRRIDRALEPLLGSMLIMSFSKTCAAAL